ncbi:MAG: FHA domain-containing protein [Agarilytica sp.]
MEKAFSIGRANKNHLCIDDHSVSEQHARISRQDDSFLLKDLGSETGTFVNGQRITQKNIVCGDEIKVGNVLLEVVDPFKEQSNGHEWSLIADSSWLTGQEFPIIGKPDDVVTIGRSPQCDIVFAGTHLSRLHAEVTINYSSLTIKDMGSANGTFVNDEKADSTQIYAGDRVRLDVYSFRVFGPGIELPKSATTSMHAIPVSEANPVPAEAKQWKSKPTSPGNREQINLYQKHYKQAIFVGAVIVGVLALAAYVVTAVIGTS